MKNEDNAKTVVRTRRMPFRPAPGTDPEQSVNVLPVGTHLGEFEILDLIGEGGFGIVYLAYDHSLERHVALKEYMPSGLATRTTSMAVTVRSQHNAATFTAGLKSFINEARMLAQFDSPSLVKVHRFWEGNGTAYMVMPFYEGITLKQALKERRVTPSEAWIRLLLADLFDAIETIHHAHCLHRDIAPDNILLLKDGRPLLLDFGAARRVIGDLTQCLTVILKPGFAPIEQYADIAGLRQGEWTDIYALAAVVYYLVTGKAPPPAVARMVHDELVPARKAGKGRYSDAFLAALDKALSVKPEQRFRSIDELRSALDIMEAVPRTLPRDSGHMATTVVRTTAIPERVRSSPPPAPQSPSHPSHLSPPPSPLPSGMRSHGRAEPRFGTIPESTPRSARPQESPPEVTQYLHAAPPIDQDWRKSTQPDARGAQRTPRNKTEWMILGLLLSAGVASGVYVGTKRLGDGAARPSVATSASGSTMESSGASEVPEEDTQSTASTRSATPSSAPPRTETSPPVAMVSPPSKAPSPPVQPQAPAMTERQQNEIELWRRASGSDKAAAYQDYLREFPQGRYASLAKLRLERMQEQAKTAMLPSTEAVPPGLPERKSKTPAPELMPPTAKGAPAKAAPPREPVRKELAARDLPPRETPSVDASPKATAQENAPAARTGQLSPEEELWAIAASINDGPAYEAYLYRYPRGKYAAVARARMNARQPAVVQRPPPEPVDRQASVKPSASPQEPVRRPSVPEAAAPAPAPAPVEPSPAAPAASSVSPPAPASPAPVETASGKKTIRAGNQTMTGDFTADPKTGIVSGSGRIAWSNGDQFDGTLVNGKKEGKGKFAWANGQRYSGDWAHDVPNGKGAIVFSDGSRYEGDVKDGVPHGQGVTRFKGGDVYRGAWVRGKSHGNGRYTWANGSYWEGEFHDDKRTDNGKMVFAENAGGGNPPAAAPQTAGEAPGRDARTAN